MRKGRDLEVRGETCFASFPKVVSQRPQCCLCSLSSHICPPPPWITVFTPGASAWQQGRGYREGEDVQVPVLD